MKHIAVVEDDSSASQQIQNYLSLYQKGNEQEFSVTSLHSLLLTDHLLYPKLSDYPP